MNRNRKFSSFFLFRKNKAILISQAFATILVNTGGIHQHSSNAYSTLLSKLKSTTTEAPGSAGSGSNTSGGNGGGGGLNLGDLISLIPTQAPGGSDKPTKPPKDLSGLNISTDVNIKDYIRKINSNSPDNRQLLSTLAEILANNYYNGAYTNNYDPYYGSYVQPPAYGGYGQYAEPYPVVNAPQPYPLVSAPQPYPVLSAPLSYGYGQYSDQYTGSEGYTNYYNPTYAYNPHQFYTK